MKFLKSSRVQQHFRQGTSFIVCGLLGLVIEFTMLRILVGYLAITPFIAYAPSKLIPAIFVFFFNKNITFRAATGKSTGYAKRFMFVYFLSFCLSYALASGLFALGLKTLQDSIFFGILFDHDRIAYAANLLAIAIMAFVNYIVSQAFIFKKTVVAPL